MADSRSIVESRSLELSESADPDRREAEESDQDRSEEYLSDDTFQ